MRMRPFEDGRWSSLGNNCMQVFMDGGLPVRIRYLRIWDGEVLRQQASDELARIFGARFRVEDDCPNGDYLESRVEMA